MSEYWTKWEPVKGVSAKYYIDSVFDSDDRGFIIELSEQDGNKKRIRILFKDWVWSYKYVQEIFAANRLAEIRKKYGEDFFNGHTFFKITESNHLQQLSQESSGILNYYGGAIHFCFVSAESILDVIANYEPIIEFIEENNCDGKMDTMVSS